MAKGLEKHRAYLDALSALGKDLARRARSRCELSGESGSLETFDLRGSDVEPSLDHVLLVSSTVLDHLEGRALADGALHYLETAVWSTEPAIRHAAVRVLEQIDESWARDAIDNAMSMEVSTEDED